MLDALKSAGFRWSRSRSIWYARQTAERLTIAQNVTGGNIGQAVQKPALLPLWERCDTSTIPEHNRHADTRTIAAETRQHLRQRFPECKFSVRIGSGGWAAANEIKACITAAPYPMEEVTREIWGQQTTRKEPGMELSAVLAYCEAWLQSYNYDNSDSMTDYFDVNFYGRFEIDSLFRLLPQSDAVKADCEAFRASKAADDLAREKVEKEAYEKERVEREQAMKEAEERFTAQEANASRIASAAIVEDLSEGKQLVISGLFGGHGKESSLAEVREMIARNPEQTPLTAHISRKVTLSEQDYLDFCDLFIYDFPFLAGKGGTAIENGRWAMVDCVGVYVGNVLRLVIDPEGYNYARYVYVAPEVVD